MIASCTADLHFSHTPPKARAVDGVSWYGVMDKLLEQLNALPSPQIWAGDVMDHWNTVPELLNFLLPRIPKNVYSCLGNHEAPNHRYEDRKRSAYWNLVEAGKLINLEPYKPMDVGQMRLWGFPFGTEVLPLKPDEEHSLAINIAVIHHFIWIKGAGHDKAQDKDLLGQWKYKLSGFTTAIVGDNHQPWQADSAGTFVFNCGTPLLRRQDERDLKPSAGLIHSDGTVTRHYLDTSTDKWADAVEKPAASGLDMSGFAAEVEGLSADNSIDFREILRRKVADNTVGEGARTIILTGLDKKGA